MDSKEFRTVFGAIAKRYGFKFLYGGWHKESEDCIVILELQRSYYSNSYHLNIKINIRGVFDSAYVLDKYLVKNAVGHLRTREPNEYSVVFKLDENLDDNARRVMLEELFKTYITPLTDKALHVEEIECLAKEKKYPMLEHLFSPVLKEEIDKKIKEKHGVGK